MTDKKTILTTATLGQAEQHLINWMKAVRTSPGALEPSDMLIAVQAYTAIAQVEELGRIANQLNDLASSARHQNLEIKATYLNIANVSAALRDIANALGAKEEQ